MSVMQPLDVESIVPKTINEALLLAYIRQMKRQKPAKKYPCDICNKVFSKSYNRTAHMRLHTNEKPFVCTFPGCNKAFTWKSSLKSHQSSHGSDESAAESRKRTFSHVESSSQDEPPRKVPSVEASDVSSTSSSQGAKREKVLVPEAVSIEDVVIPLDVGEDYNVESLALLDEVNIAEFVQGCTTSKLAGSAPGITHSKAFGQRSSRLEFDNYDADLQLFSPVVAAAAKLPSW
mmetsp:Transcript_30357/g.73977  ORF Transcript_30357/g.73977 Transcript_30357/m.73977 type:complete len:233 (+) Transcript_30357:371-1069(+)